VPQRRGRVAVHGGDELRQELIEVLANRCDEGVVVAGEKQAGLVDL
jgi:hypothetical protein